MAYGKYRHSTFNGEKGSTWNVEIWKNGFDQPGDTSTEIDLSGEGFEITWNGQGGTRDRVFLGSECKLNCIVKDGVDESFLYDTIDSGYQEYFIRIYRGAVSNTNLWWYGWVQPAFDKVENLPFPYVFQITATDSYGFWSKKKEETFANDTERNTAHSVRDILFTLIHDMDIHILSGSNESPIPQNLWWCRTSLDWYREGETNTSADPAVLYKAAKGFVNNTPSEDEDGNSIDSAFKYKPSDVFNGVLKAFNTVGFLAEGHYNFIQPNSLANNTSGNINVFEYNSGLISNPSNPFSLNTLLTIDQSNNVILGGSTLNYEPSFESVAVNFKGGFSNFNITPGQLLNTEFYCGSLQSGLTGNLNLVFRAEYFERISSFNTSFLHSVDKWSFTTTGTLKIRITDGSTTKYLTQTQGSSVLTWENTESPILIYRGYGVNDSLPVNNNSYMAVGNTSVPYGQIGSPTSMYSPGSTSYHKFWTKIYFNATVEQPPITGDVYLEFDCSNYYYQRNDSTDAVSALPGSQPTPTAGTPSITCEQIELTPSEYNEENNVSDGVTYTAIQDNNDAIEQFDLGDVKLGKSLINDLSSIKYGSGNETVSGFRRGTSGDFQNPSLLLVNEFLELQVDPLEILQADIQSADISPLKLVKYSIDDDINHKYYSFLGGTFKAQSEILSGEWFRINSSTSNIINDQYYSGHKYIPNTTPTQQVLYQQNLVSRQMLDNNSYGKITTALSSGTSYTKVSFSAASKGKIYNGQKLVLTYPDKSNPLLLTAAGDSNTSDTVIDLASFTPNIIYPVGSVLSPLLYDLTNVITGGGGTSTPNLFRGINTSFIYIRANEFNVTSHTSFSMYTRDNVGSVQPTATQSRGKIYATTFVPPTYEVTSVNIYASVNRNIRVLEGRTNNDTTTLIDTGTSNTTMTLSTAYQGVDGRYLILEFEQGSATDEIYGGKIAIQSV